ncbi:hypothetical protein [Virgibacillus sp. DJP39]|uniref:hypothetical protein n=1 Tax=Virgibacillus sp. DJP39 TaxID=3409790 RepID=UPI003BB70A54
MNIFTFMPIIIIITIIGLVVLVIKRNTKKQRKYLSGEKIRWMLGAYLLILLISVGMFLLIPSNSGSIANEKADLGSSYLVKSLHNGNAADIDEKFIAKKWKFDFKGEMLTFLAPGNDVNGISIFVEEKMENDGIVEVMYYQTPTYVEGMNVSDRIKLAQVKLRDNRLIISKPDQLELNFTAFKQEFIMNQFTEGDSMNLNGSLILGAQALYIRIPKTLNVQQDEYGILQYIRE